MFGWDRHGEEMSRGWAITLMSLLALIFIGIILTKYL